MWRSLFLILILFSSIAFAQTQEKPKAIKFDEFEDILTECDLTWRLDKLLLEWKANQNSKLHIVQYIGINDLPANFNGRYLKRFKNFISNHFYFRTLKRDVATFTNGGFREKFTQELWLVPEGAEIPQPLNTLPTPRIPTDKTFQYAFEYLVPCYLADPIELLTVENRSERLKEEKEQVFERKKNGKIEDDFKYRKGILEDSKFGWAVSSFGEILKSQEGSIGTIFFYADSDLYSVKNIRKHVEEGKRKIAKESNISPSRIKVAFGGYRSLPQAEFWVIPKNSELPKPKPENREN